MQLTGLEPIPLILCGFCKKSSQNPHTKAKKNCRNPYMLTYQQAPGGHLREGKRQDFKKRKYRE